MAPVGHRVGPPSPAAPMQVGVQGWGAHLARQGVPGGVGKAGGRWVSFRVSCLACAGTGKMLHPWLYTSPPPPAQTQR